jgi:hypothetical protein
MSDLDYINNYIMVQNMILTENTQTKLSSIGHGGLAGKIGFTLFDGRLSIYYAE